MPAVGGSLLAEDRSAPLVTPDHGPPPGPGAPPRLVLVVSGAVVTAGLTMAVVGALRTGVSWDEPFHVMRLRNYFDHGWFAVDWSVGHGGATTGESNTLVYGPVTMLLLHGLCVALGIEGWQTVATTPEAYAARHLGVVAIGLVGTAAAAATTRILLGSWRWALVTAAALLALPMWTGHLMFNIKDVPVATGYALVTLGLVAMVPPTFGRAALRVLALFAGAVLMVGTRPAMASALLGTVALVAVATGLRRERLRPVLVEPAAALVAAAVLLVVVYPGVYAEPLRLLRSAEQSTSFRGGGGAGPFYVPFYLATQFPLLLQAAAVLGLWYTASVHRRWYTNRGVPNWYTNDRPQAVRLGLVVCQVAALPLVGVLTDADLYNGLRQLLFALPAWGVLATLGIAYALTWARGHGRAGVASAVAAVALVVPVVDQLSLFPYQYTYANAALDATGVDLDTDYWRTSVPELLPQLPTDGQVVCSPSRTTESGAPAGSPLARGVDESAMVAQRFSADSSADCRTDPLGPLQALWADRDLPLDDELPHDEFYAVIDRGHAVPANCTMLASVERTRHLRAVPMTYVARCRLDPPLLDTPVAFWRWAGENMHARLWAHAAEGWEMRRSPMAIDAPGGAASLTFEMPEDCTACELRLDADAPADLVATVNDEPRAVHVADGEVRVQVGTGVTWVTFTRPTGAPLGLRVRAIRVVPTGAG